MKNLKIGQTFEVVEVLCDIGNSKLEGNHGLLLNKSTYNEVLCTNAWHYIHGYYDSKVALMLDSEIKPIGRLIIKSIK